MFYLLRNILSITKSYLFGILYFYQYKLLSKNDNKTDKAVLLVLSHNFFKRYLYLFIKFLHLEGYTIYLKSNFSDFYYLRTEQFGSYLFLENIVCVDKPPKNIKIIVVNVSALNPNYFEDPILNKTAYHVPMSQHPIMYKEGWWKAPIVEANRKQSLFMAGNFDESTYLTIEQDQIFKTQSRPALYNYLNQKQLLYPVHTLQNLDAFYTSQLDFKILLLDRLKLNVPMDVLRDWLAKFDFYFALPGVVMPFSHNIIEAMSVGCIPFLQQSYADMFKPPLINSKQVITFTNLTDLKSKIEYLFGLESIKIEIMRTEVYTYYNSYLTPAKVVANLEKANFKNSYLQAEHYSVALLKESKLQNKTDSK